MRTTCEPFRVAEYSTLVGGRLCCRLGQQPTPVLRDIMVLRDISVPVKPATESLGERVDALPGAGVSQDVPDDQVVGGRPAQILRNIFNHIEERNVRAVEVFFAVDTDGSGEMDRMEFEEALAMMKVVLSLDDMHLAFDELDSDKGGTIDIEEFMGRMRLEKKWRVAREQRKRGIDPDDDRRIGMLSGDEKAEAIMQSGQKAWEKAVMRSALSVWGSNMPQDMDEDEATWRKEELEAQMAEMAAEKEEEEAAAAEALYDKEELEAIQAEAKLQQEEEEARQAVEDAEREEQEALEAIARAEKEEAEAKLAEQEAEVEVEEAEIARLDAEREQLEALEAVAIAEKELADVLRAEADLQNAEADLDVARATNDQAAIEAAEGKVQAARVTLDREKKEAVDAKAVADKEQAEAEDAMKVAEKEKREALQAISDAARERQEANEAKAVAQREMEEAREAKARAEQESAEAAEAREDAIRERAEAEEAKLIATKERAEADEARRIAIKERAEANAAKEVWAQRKAMEQALNWKRKTKMPTKKKLPKVKKEKGPPPRSVVDDMLGRVVGNLVRFESEYKAEAQPPPEVAENSLRRAERLQQLRMEYEEALTRNFEMSSPRSTAGGGGGSARRSPRVRRGESPRMSGARGSMSARDPTAAAYSAPLIPHSPRSRSGLKVHTGRAEGAVHANSLQQARQAARQTVHLKAEVSREEYQAVYREAALLNAFERSNA